ncbi:tetratricopeptide repeat protein [Photobacterium leiognathi]|uniref:tetratricopeptide repeat protein n=1 Tax=Photobacterium leiognathi TaxID=553611 RepID=UPI002982400E|nr:tetratricopeptide repeat protein [Photobacterium leiognathi]
MRKFILISSIFIPSFVSASQVSFNSLVEEGSSLAGVQIYLAEENIKLSNYEEALNNYITASKNGVPSAIYNAIEMFNNGYGNKDSFIRLLPELEKEANRGSVDVSKAIASLYMDSKIGDDMHQAFFWFNRAYKLGDDESAFKVVKMIIDDDLGDYYSYPEIATILRDLSNKGYGEASYRLSIMFSDGKYLKPNPTLSRKFIDLSVEQSFEYSYYLAGWYAEKGIGGDVDIDQAKKYYLMASKIDERGLAEYRLSRFHLYGIASESVDPIKAVDLLKISAEKGNLDGIRKLAQLFELGIHNVEKSKTEAIKWYKLGSSLGDHQSKIAIEKLTK